MASASIGQVHRRALNSGETVVVKVLHADIEKKVAVDLDILAGLAQLAEMIPEFQPYRPRAIVAEFQRTMRRELDFGREGATSSSSPTTSATTRSSAFRSRIPNFRRAAC